MPAITLDEINNNKLFSGKGIAISYHKFQDFGPNKTKVWKIFDVYTSYRNPVRLLKNILLSEYYLCKSILWADIIIWQWDARIFLPHYWFLKITGKIIYIEWVGSDIRKPKLLSKINKFYKQEFELGTYSYLNESNFRSWFRQIKFKFLNAIPLLCPEMSLYLDKKLFPQYIKTMQRINSDKYIVNTIEGCLLYTSPSPRDGLLSRMPSSA